MKPFRILSWSNRFAGKWVVIRMNQIVLEDGTTREDNRVMYESHSLYGCLRWVSIWGSTLGQHKRGIEFVRHASSYWYDRA